MQPTLNLPNPEAWLDAEQAIAKLGVSRATLYAMLADGRIGDYKIGAVRVFWRVEIDELAQALKRVKARRA
ncbi:MAG: hypothetical protein QOG34_2537 [Frankiaceae bacterium]|jgi:excisionase family DNA binding protein|nr:hypothetical protein [Frankiaceae bacterium]